MGEIVVDVGLENVGDRELAKAGHLQEADIRREGAQRSRHRRWAGCRPLVESAN